MFMNPKLTCTNKVLKVKHLCFVGPTLAERPSRITSHNDSSEN